MVEPNTMCTILLSTILGGGGLLGTLWCCWICRNEVSVAPVIEMDEAIKIEQEQPPMYAEHDLVEEQIATITIPPLPPPAYIEPAVSASVTHLST